MMEKDTSAVSLGFLAMLHVKCDRKDGAFSFFFCMKKIADDKQAAQQHRKTDDDKN
ncbi:hypothetical protein NSQ51_02890 [Geobacillus sp. FSL K6-0789]|nr:MULTISPECIES: hypothetical protein [Geobacillus]MBR2516493.1 hypothetical protein [Geobacillus sp.]MED3663920.1 hypothetical protein [Geobacillus stearothermophilus]MED3720199.1 hypothetical protein [Geobacillus stearothermophilus]MED3722241.1 hypothetical protein [Geobacillus stearothermophilus]MED3731344.1 hypothetical protein [Geobacillus stearothermophilus]